MAGNRLTRKGERRVKWLKNKNERKTAKANKIKRSEKHAELLEKQAADKIARAEAKAKAIAELHEAAKLETATAPDVAQSTTQTV